jgi:hypothetical protein
MSTENDSTPPAPKKKRRMAMTKADWERVERQVHKSEANPDPSQIALLDDDTAAA